jgi:glycosyltransferase involved in cell wall biosynthesis
MRRKIISNFPALGPLLQNHPDFEHELAECSGSIADEVRLLRHAMSSADFLLTNVAHQRLFLACGLFGALQPRPFRRCRIISVDLILRPPQSAKARLLCHARRLLLRQVDLFILYFRSVEGYVKHFGLSGERIAYVPFKVNGWERLRGRRAALGDGEYVLLSGRTLRDYVTFVDAVKKSGVPAVLLVPPEMRGEIERATWYRSNRPPNLRVEFDTDGTEETYTGYFENARIVCFPRFAWDIAPSGISGYLCAMALGRCVAISRGPAAEDVLDRNAALFFEPGDADGLAQLLRRAWDDRELRQRVSTSAIEYTNRLAGEERLLGDIVSTISERFPADGTMPTCARDDSSWPYLQASARR